MDASQMSSLTLVRGPSAATLVTIGQVAYAVLLTPLVFCGLVTLGISQVWLPHRAETSKAGITLILAACAVTAAILVVSFVLSPIQERREIARGYTSMRAAHQAYAQVLPGTAWIVRQSGASYLTEAEWHAKKVEAATMGVRPMLPDAQPSRLLLALQGFLAITVCILLPWFWLGHFAALASLATLVILMSAFAGVVALIRRAKRRPRQSSPSQ